MGESESNETEEKERQRSCQYNDLYKFSIALKHLTKSVLQKGEKRHELKKQTCITTHFKLVLI